MLRALQPLELDPFDEVELESTLVAMIRRASQPFKPLARQDKQLGIFQWFIRL